MKNEHGFHPRGERILLKVIKPENKKTDSGIEVIEEVEMPTQRAVVIAVGDSDKIEVKPGMEVVYNIYTGFDVTGLDDQEYRFCMNSDIFAIIEK